MTGGDARTAVRDRRGAAVGAERMESRLEVIRVPEAAGLVDVPRPWRASRSWDVTRTRVDRFDVAPIPLGGAGVEQRRSSGAQLLDARRIHDLTRGPGATGERTRRPWLATTRLERCCPRRNPAIENGGTPAGTGEHPPQPGRDRPAGVVVGHDEVAVAESERRHGAGEVLGRGQRMASRAVAGRAGKNRLDVDEDRAGDVPGLVRDPSAPAVEVPAHVGG